MGARVDGLRPRLPVLPGRRRRVPRKILTPWLKAGLAAEWRGRFAGAGDFFGVGRETVYVGVGGMHTVTAGAAQTLECNHSNFVARRGVRVGAVARAGDRWALSGVGGEAAIHDSSLKSSDVEAARAAAALGEFDAVIVTDASAAQESWHRASAGLPEAFLAMSKRVRDRVRVAMFTAIVAFEERVPVSRRLSFEGPVLWYAARTNSKPGFEASRRSAGRSQHAGWAAAEVERVPMRTLQQVHLFLKVQRSWRHRRGRCSMPSRPRSARRYQRTRISTRSAGALHSLRPSRTVATPTAARTQQRTCSGPRSTRRPRNSSRVSGAEAPATRTSSTAGTSTSTTPATSARRARRASSPPRCRGNTRRRHARGASRCLSERTLSPIRQRLLHYGKR